MILQYHCEQL